MSMFVSERNSLCDAGNQYNEKELFISSAENVILMNKKSVTKQLNKFHAENINTVEAFSYWQTHVKK